MITLIDSFVSGEITAPEFERKYLTLWREHRDSAELKTRDNFTPRYFDSVFSSVDSYCSDPDLIDEDDLDDQGLLDAVSNLKAMWEESVLV
ncbi:colicin immunity domain-containing protein [Scandinavium goeteborgense]|uniref:colicin immunity domain-containing protein n=1 Tax=Scandinavium goeteborgense TaxID=1851514 RepID=UPI0014477578|nr:colicin immunity domain-containing protein [Scandinavium goeteborgense]QKN80147.1 hypothetical protein A8O29_002130 [Scandinavium goeteborgense]